MSEYDVDEGLSERVEAEKSGAGGQLPLPARAPRSESPPELASTEAIEGGGSARSGAPRVRQAKASRGSKLSPPPSTTRCTAHAPAGTRCKLCGKVHPQRQGRSVKIHIPGSDLEAKEDFK